MIGKIRNSSSKAHAFFAEDTAALAKAQVLLLWNERCERNPENSRLATVAVDFPVQSSTLRADVVFQD